MFCPGKACVRTWRQGEKPGVCKIGRVGLGHGMAGLGLSLNLAPGQDNPWASGLSLRYCLGCMGCFGANQHCLPLLQAQDLHSLSIKLNS